MAMVDTEPRGTIRLFESSGVDGKVKVVRSIDRPLAAPEAVAVRFANSGVIYLARDVVDAIAQVRNGVSRVPFNTRRAYVGTQYADLHVDRALSGASVQYVQSNPAARTVQAAIEAAARVVWPTPTLEDRLAEAEQRVALLRDQIAQRDAVQDPPWGVLEAEVDA